MSEELTRVPLTHIRPSRWQPRETVFDADRLGELAASIREAGLINAVVVFPVTADGRTDYELVAGERRVRALSAIAWADVDGITQRQAVETLAREGLAGLPAGVRAVLEAGDVGIAAHVEPAPAGEDDLLRLHRMAVVENIERESLNPLEEARALEGLADSYGWSQRELARRIGKSQSYVAQRLSLLGLAEEAQAAVSTRVLSPTHARAIARVPEPLQPAATRWALQAIERDDGPATTRQVQNRLRQLAAFVDPERWLPNENEVYQPIERNRLMMLHWAVQRAAAEGRLDGQVLLGLAETDHLRSNLLSKKPRKLVDNHYDLRTVLQALGLTQAEVWPAFAADTNRTCRFCIFRSYSDIEASHADGPLRAHCQKWVQPDVETCERYIGPADPVIIPLTGYAMPDLFREVGAAVVEEPFDHMTSVADYVKAYSLALALEAEQSQQKEQEKERQHLLDIEAFVEWQLEQSDAVLNHFQSHSCAKCANYRPEYLEQGMPACRFATEPLKARYYDRGPAAPKFRVLVSDDGLLFPRCEQFAYREVPTLQGVMLADRTGLSFGRTQECRERVLAWLVIIAGGYLQYGTGNWLWGSLRWLDYGRPVEKNDDRRLQRWLLEHWEDLGGDEVIATLIDVAINEIQMMLQRRPEMHLLNPVTGEIESFAHASWDSVRQGKPVDRWYGYPDGWPQPWVRDGGDA